MSVVVFVVGEPGCGKTTLVRHLIGRNIEIQDKPKWTWNEAGVCAAGHYTGHAFDGADRVPYNGVKMALRFWEARLGDSRVTLFDGDRFSIKPVTTWAQKSSQVSKIGALLLDLPAEIAENRRRNRGTFQNTSWVLGRKTKAMRFAGGFDHRLDLDARRRPEELALLASSFVLDLESQS